jgi:hypothetical protein
MNYHIINQNSIVLNFDGRVISVSRKTFDRFNELYDALKSKNFDAVKFLFDEKVETEVPEIIPGTGLKLIGKVLVDADSEALPVNLSNKIQELFNEGFDVQSLVNFWNNTKENPSRHSREQLYRFLCDNEHPITDDGHFIAYRNVTKNFKDHHTGKFDNSVGNVLEMPRREVDDDPNSHCSYGFHVAKFSYASTFKSGVLVSVKVNPRDVVAVPNDYNGEKMRVCRFEVMEVIEQKLSGIDFSIIITDDDKYEEDEWGDLPFYSEEDEYEEFVDDMIDLAIEHKDRYSDIISLSLRVSEAAEDYAYSGAFDLSPAGILKILSQNKSRWQ